MLYLPTCVGLRYGRCTLWLEAFLGGLAQSVRLGPESAPSHHPSVIAQTDLPIRAPYRLGGLAAPDLPPRVPPSLITIGSGTGI